MSGLLASVALLGGLGLLAAVALTLASRRLPADNDSVVEAIDALLPQTQCAQCGYPGCRPYAQAVAQGEALDLCPPGGQETQAALARLLDRAPGQPVNKPQDRVARIDEARCIGCTLCIPPCPVDAIIGAQKLMHTVLTEHCTGCELCIDPCPVDCIDLVPRS